MTQLQYTPCDRDSDCSEGHFCKSKAGFPYCQRCHNCTGRYRRQPARDGCARTAGECGGCLSGFEAEEQLDGSQKDICQPVTFQGKARIDIEIWQPYGLP